MRIFSGFQIGKHAAENGVAATMHFCAKKFVLKKVAYEPGKTLTPKFLSRCVHAVRVKQVLWEEQFWNSHPQKLDREIFEDCPSAKIGPLENFPLYGIYKTINIEKCKRDGMPKSMQTR